MGGGDYIGKWGPGVFQGFGSSGTVCGRHRALLWQRVLSSEHLSRVEKEGEEKKKKSTEEPKISGEPEDTEADTERCECECAVALVEPSVAGLVFLILKDTEGNVAYVKNFIVIMLHNEILWCLLAYKQIEKNRRVIFYNIILYHFYYSIFIAKRSWCKKTKTKTRHYAHFN